MTTATRGKYYQRYRDLFPGYRYLLVEGDPARVTWFRNALPLHCFDHADASDRARLLITLGPSPYDGFFVNQRVGEVLAQWLVETPSAHPKVPVVVYGPGREGPMAHRLRLSGWEAEWVPTDELVTRHGV